MTEEQVREAAPFASRYGLVRPLQGRYLAGVCAALGRGTRTDPVLWRVVLAVLVCFLGIGAVIYLVVWLLTPEEGDTASPVEALLGRGQSSMSPVVAVLIGVVVVFLLVSILPRPLYLVLAGLTVLAGLLLITRAAPGTRTAPGSGGVPPTGPVPPTPAAGPTPAPGTTAGPGFPPVPATAGTGPAGAPVTAAAPPSGATGPAPPGAAPGLLLPPPAGPPPAGPPSAGPAPAGPPPAGIPPAGHPPPGFPPIPVPTGAAGGTGYRPPFAPRGPFAGPPPPPPPPPRPPRERSSLPALIFFAILAVLGGLGMLDLTGVLNVPATGYLAAALAVVGAGLLTGAWLGRARPLIALGVVLALALPVVHAMEAVDPPENVGDLTWVPQDRTELADEYALTFGSGVVDLRGVDFSGHRTELTIRIMFGEMRVALPDDVAVEATVRSPFGGATVFGESRDWASGETVTDPGSGDPADGTLLLDLHAQFGQLEVHR